MENKAVKDYVENERLDIELVVNTYQNYIYGIVKNRVGNKSDAEEITSDVFFIFWKNYHKNLVLSESQIKPYLLGIANHLINKKYHENKISTEPLEGVEINDYLEVEKTVEVNEQMDIVEQMIKEMKDSERKIFLLFYYQNFKIKDIAHQLKISDVKVKVNLHRLRKRAMRKLNERGYGNEYK